MKENMKQAVGRSALGGVALMTMLGLGVLLAGPSSAADADVTAAFTTLTADIKVYIGAIVALVVLAVTAGLGIAWLRKARSA